MMIADAGEISTMQNMMRDETTFYCLVLVAGSCGSPISAQ